MFFPFEPDQEAQEQRQEYLDAVGRNELQKLVSHSFFGGSGAKSGTPRYLSLEHFSATARLSGSAPKLNRCLTYIVLSGVRLSYSHLRSGLDSSVWSKGCANCDEGHIYL